MKKLLFTLLAVMATLAMNAEQVSKQEALQKAQHFMPGKSFTVASSPSMTRGVESPTDEADLYILNADGGGFVIVSGDDRTEPILGYSDKGEFRLDHMPDNVRYWLESYVEQIKALDKGATPVIKARTRSAQPVIEPLIKTQWDQYAPYNLRCPEFSKQHSLTGCVATALAQVMYYYQCPETSTAIPAYTTSTRGKYMPELPAVTFKWDLMKENYSVSEKGDAAEAVAELMLYAGQACEMNYNLGASGASLNLDGMRDYFGFSKNMYAVSREYYSVARWESLIYHELEERRPVLYTGHSSDSGHEFICDGYDGNGLFHINWGWGGGSDGYFVLSLAKPYEKGAGGGSGPDGYGMYQRAVIGCKPASEDESDMPRIYSGISQSYYAEYSRSSTNQAFMDIQLNIPVKVAYSYIPSTTSSVELGWALCKDGQLQSVLASSTVVIDNRDKDPYFTKSYYGPTTVSFGAGFNDGNYTIEQVYKQEGDNEWHFCINPAEHFIVATISGNDLTLRANNAKNLSFIVNDVTCSGDMGVGDEISVSINMTSTCDVMQETIYVWDMRNGKQKELGWGYGSVEPGKTGTVDLTFIPTAAGTYDISITTDSEGKNVIGTFTVTIYEVEEVTVDNIVYKCNTGSGNAVVKGNTYSYDNKVDIVIPSQVVSSKTSATYHVKKIADRAFNDFYEFNTLTIEEGVEEIGEAAFCSSLNLKTLDLPSTLKKIGNTAFSTCNYLKMVICRMAEPCEVSSDMFEVIWGSADGETQISFPSATLYVPVGSKEKYANAPVWKNFAPIYQGEPKELTLGGITYQCATGDHIAIAIKGNGQELSNKDVTIPSTIVDAESSTSYSVKVVAEHSFWGIYMNSLTIESGVEEIGEEAFIHCKINKIELPATLTTIGKYAFANNSELATVVSHMETPCTISRDVFAITKQVDGEDVELFTNAALYIPEGSKTKYKDATGWKDFDAIYQGELLEWTTDDGVTYAYVTGEDFATVVKGDKDKLNYKDVTILSKIELNGKIWHVKSISAKAFYNMSLNSLVIEPGIEEIKDNAFALCYGLNDVVIPEGVKSIGEKSFFSCTIKTLELPSTLTSIGERAFAYNNYLHSVVVHMEMPISINENVFICEENVDGQWIQKFTDAVLYVPVGFRSVYAETPVWSEFSTIYQGELKDLTTDEGITYSYITGESIATLVKGDNDLLRNKDVIIPSQIEVDGKVRYVKSIAKGAFCYAYVNSLVIEPGIEIIEDEAFWNANSYYWQNLVIPESVTTIGESAFRYCYALKYLELPSTLTTIKDNAFGKDKFKRVVVHMLVPCAINEDMFDETVFTSATLFVPVGSKETYKNAAVWQKFSSIAILGDADGDGDVDQKDVDAIVNHITGYTPVGFDENAADINGDSKVNVTDVTMVVNIINNTK